MDKIGYLVRDLRLNEEFMIHTDKEYRIGEIIEYPMDDYFHECKILEVYKEK